MKYYALKSKRKFEFCGISKTKLGVNRYLDRIYYNNKLQHPKGEPTPPKDEWMKKYYDKVSIDIKVIK